MFPEWKVNKYDTSHHSLTSELEEELQKYNINVSFALVPHETFYTCYITASEPVSELEPQYLICVSFSFHVSEKTLA